MNHRCQVVSSIALLILACALGCRGHFKLQAEGTLASGIDFIFTDADHKPTSVPLRELEVRSENGSMLLWHIVGRTSIDRILYGAAPDGFDVLVEPMELEPSRRYRVSAQAQQWPGAPANGDVLFEITSAGIAQSVPEYYEPPAIP